MGSYIQVTIAERIQQRSFFPEDKKTFFGIIDVPGSQEAHRVNDSGLTKKMKSKEIKTPNEKIKENSNNEEYYTKYKTLRNDAKITNPIKEKFLIEHANIVVVCVNKLSESD